MLSRTAESFALILSGVRDRIIENFQKKMCILDFKICILVYAPYVGLPKFLIGLPVISQFYIG